MDANKKELFYAKTYRKYSFESFTISIVNFVEQDTKEFSKSNRLLVSATILGGNYESRKRTVVHKGEENHDLFSNLFPATKLIIAFDERFFNDHTQFSQLEVGYIIRKIYCELLLNSSYAPLFIEQMVRSLFTTSGEMDSKNWFIQLKETLNGRWDEFPSLIDLSSQLSVHPVTISKYFSKHSGMTLSEYMRKIKVKRAVDMLLNSSESFASIAFRCGFSDQSHMNRLIKRYIGHTPGAIRSIA